MSSRSIVSHLVQISPFQAWRDGTPEWTTVRAQMIEYDEVGVTMKVPTFSVRFYDGGGVFQHQFAEGDIVRITKGNRLKFLGVVNEKSPSKSDTQSLMLEGNAYYYDVLMHNYTVTKELFKEGGQPNIWKVGRDDPNEDSTLIDGIRPDQWIEMLMGYKLHVQEFFDSLDGIDDTSWFSFDDSDLFSTRVASNEAWVEMANTTGVFKAPTSKLAELKPSDTYETQVLALSFSNSIELNGEYGFYLDNVTLKPDDIIKIKYRGTFNNDSIRARIRVFENGEFNHPIGGEPNKSLIMGDVFTGLAKARKTLAGRFSGEEGTYRIAVAFYTQNPVQAEGTITFEDIELVEKTGFQGVSVEDSRVCLSRAEPVEGRTMYRETGAIRSIPFFAGNPNLKQPGLISGQVGILARGTAYVREYTAYDNRTKVIPYGYKVGDRVVFHPTFSVSNDGGEVWSTYPDANPLTMSVTDLDGNAIDFNTIELTEETVTGEDPDEEIVDPPMSAQVDVLWTGSIDVADLVTVGSDLYKFVWKVDMAADKLGSPCVEYLHATVGTETFLREISDITGTDPVVMTYSPDHTAPFLESIREYQYPLSLADDDPDKQERYSTFAHEFFFETIWDALGVIVKSTTKTDSIDRQGLSSFQHALAWYTYNQTPDLVGTDSTANDNDATIGSTAVVSVPYKSEWAVRLVSDPDAYIKLDGVQWDSQFAWWSRFLVRNVSDGVIYDSTDSEGYKLELNADGSLTLTATDVAKKVKTQSTSAGLIVANQEYTLTTQVTGKQVAEVWLNERRIFRLKLDNYANDNSTLYIGGNTVDNAAEIDVIESLLFDAALLEDEISELSYPGFESADGAWNFQVSHEGGVTFAENIGRYMGRNAREGIQRRFSFDDNNIRLIKPKKTITDITNALIFVAEGIPGLDDLTLLGTEFIDRDSVSKYGMRMGRYNEKDIKDVFMANNRAHSILREMSKPQVELDVELSDDLVEELNVGDIIYIKDNGTGVDSDFRIFEKRISVSESEEKARIKLSTRNRTLGALIEKVQKKFRELDNTKRQAAYESFDTQEAQAVSVSNPFATTVTISPNASQTLQRVTLDVTSRAGAIKGVSGSSTTAGFISTELDGAHEHVTPPDGAHQHLIDTSQLDLTTTTNVNPALTNGRRIFPINVVLSVNNANGASPYSPFGSRGSNVYGDFADSQETNIGFQVKGMDISDIFKNDNGEWVPGQYTIYLIPTGTDSQVNPDNVGLLSARIRKITTG